MINITSRLSTFDDDEAFLPSVQWSGLFQQAHPIALDKTEVTPQPPTTIYTKVRSETTDDN